MGDVVFLNEYKKQHGIPLPRSPYYTLKATQEQLREAYRLASELLEVPFDYRGVPPYAVLVGYEEIKSGNIKLLKRMHAFSTKKAFESMAGINGHYCIALVRKCE